MIFIYVGWPQVQELFELEDFSSNSFLAVEGDDSSYAVNLEWLLAHLGKLEENKELMNKLKELVSTLPI